MHEPDPLITSSHLVGLLADRERLRVVAALVLGASDLATIREQTGIELPEIAKALSRLVDKGLVEHDAEFNYVLITEAFQIAARSDARHLAAQDSSRAEQQHRDLPDEQAKVLRTFIRDGRLTQIPVQMQKKEIVLEYLAQQFEPGRRYSEKMVNLVLGGFHADTAALRRYLVDFGFLDRDAGQYWRSGGRIDDPTR